MTTVQSGDRIRIHYIGRLEDGTVFDTSAGGASLELTIGRGEFIAGLEEGVIGMSSGETKTIHMPCEKAYGPHLQERVFIFHKSRLPEDFNAEVGQQMQLFRADGVPVPVRITAKTDEGYTMDCNHPLAGKDLIFEVTIEKILSPDEIEE